MALQKVQNKRAIWLAETLLGIVAIILALQGNTTEAVAVTGFIATTMDKMVQ
jgi:hypothetical protein